jgi:hypothetical protein
MSYLRISFSANEPSLNQLPGGTPMKVMPCLRRKIIHLTMPLMTPIHHYPPARPLAVDKAAFRHQGFKHIRLDPGHLYGIEQLRPVGRRARSFKLDSR